MKTNMADFVDFLEKLLLVVSELELDTDGIEKDFEGEMMEDAQEEKREQADDPKAREIMELFNELSETSQESAKSYLTYLKLLGKE